MREIRLRDAKSTLSAVIDDAVRGEPSVITRHGRPQAVVVGFEEVAATGHRAVLRPAPDGGPARVGRPT